MLNSKWEFVKLKYLTNEKLMYGANESAELDDRELPRYIRITDLDTQGNLKEDTFKSLPREKAQRYYLKEGDLLLARSGATVGKSYIHNGKFEACFAGYLIRFRANRKKLLPKFVYYYTKTQQYEDWIKENTIQATIQNVSAEKYANLSIPLPPITIQNNIVNFLDKKVEDIDTLVLDKERLIDLLEEKKYAIITETVTKGLERNREMRESGLVWLNSIPENWDIVKLKTVVDVHSSNVDKKSKDGEVAIQLCNYVDVYYNDVITSNLNFMRATARPDQIETFSLRQDDVIITKDSESPDDIAVPAWVEKSLKNVVCGYHLSILRPKKLKIEGKYLYYTLLSNGIKDQFELNANGVTRFGLSMHAIKNAIIPSPPLKEQRDIILYLDKKISKINEIKEVTRSQIQKLREYRQTLISEAVTGKIDVSNYPLERKEETHVN